MKRLMCSAAIASALLAATAIPSGAAVIDLLGMSSVAGTTYDDYLLVHLPTTETVMVAGAEFNIAPFTVTGLPFSVTSTPPPSFGIPSLFRWVRLIVDQEIIPSRSWEPGERR